MRRVDRPQLKMVACLRVSEGRGSMVGRSRRLLGLVAVVAFAASACGSTSAPLAATPAATTVVPTVSAAASPWATVKPGFAPTGPTQTAKVVRIVDGDTIV